MIRRAVVTAAAAMTLITTSTAKTVVLECKYPQTSSDGEVIPGWIDVYDVKESNGWSVYDATYEK